MYRFSPSAALLIIIAAAALAGCTSNSDVSGPTPPAHVTVGHNGTVSVVLTPLAAQRTGLQTAVATRAGRGPQTVVPYSALLYQPDGTSVVYTVTGPLTYTLATVSIVSMQGSQVYLTGLTPGTVVVTVGGEELLGVQDGVGVET